MQNINNILTLKNKKAVSQVVTTVLILVLTISAVALISVAINSTIKNQLTLSPKTSCLEMQFSPPIKIEKACYDANTNDTEITLKRNPDDKIQINSLSFSINSGSESTSFSCGEACGNCQILKIGEIKTYYFNRDKKPTEASVKIDNCLIETKSIVDC